MAANTQPIYSKAGDIQWATIPSGAGSVNTAKDGTGTLATNVFAVFAADATNGGRVERIRFRALGTNVATVARVFINNGLTNATAANNTLWAEITLGATTLSEVAALLTYELPNANSVPDTSAFPIALPPGYRLLVTIGTQVAAGFSVTAIGGKY